MTDNQKELIGRLIKTYRGSSTESLIGTITTTDGMLEACRTLLSKRDTGANELKTWLQHRCEQAAIDEQAFLHEMRTIIELFSPHTDDEDPYQVLGLTAEAGPEQIKRAYRKLSLQYHPDTASEQSRNEPDQFIKITRAYQTLLGNNTEPLQPIKQRTTNNNTWRQKKQATSHSPQRKKVFAWTLGLLILLLIVSFIAATNYRKKTMIAGLQHSRGAFIPPPTKTVATVTPTTSTKKTDLPQVIIEQQTPKQEQPPKDQPPVSIDKDTSASPPPTTHEEPLSPPREVEKITNSSPKSKPNIKQPQSSQEVTEAPQITPEPTIKQQPEHQPSSEIAKLEQVPEPIPEVAKAEISKEQSTNSELIASNSDSYQKMLTETSKESSLELPTDKPDVTDEELYVGPPSATTKDLSTEALAKVEASAKVEPPPLDQRLKSFFDSYLSAYNERNILSFSRFFAVDAVENGKPFATKVQTYMELFQKTDSAVLQIKDLDWSKTSNQIEATGRFNVNLNYRNGRRVSGTGPITFRLQKDGNSFLVTSLEYHFEH